MKECAECHNDHVKAVLILEVERLGLFQLLLWAQQHCFLKPIVYFLKSCMTFPVALGKLIPQLCTCCEVFRALTNYDPFYVAFFSGLNFLLSIIMLLLVSAVWKTFYIKYRRGKGKIRATLSL